MDAVQSLVLLSSSPRHTENIGAALYKYLKRGGVLALFGDLATGKTCLVRGIAEDCKISDPVHSPTFTLVNQYGTPPVLYHLDLYRVSSPDDLQELGIEEIFDGEILCVVEWAERAPGLLPERRVDIQLSHTGGDNRQLEITNYGLMSADWLADFKEKFMIA